MTTATFKKLEALARELDHEIMDAQREANAEEKEALKSIEEEAYKLVQKLSDLTHNSRKQS